MARKIREDEHIDNEGRIRRKKKSKDVSEIYDEASNDINNIMDSIGGI